MEKGSWGGERLRAKAGGRRSLENTRWSRGKGHLRRGKGISWCFDGAKKRLPDFQGRSRLACLERGKIGKTKEGGKGSIHMGYVFLE